MRQEDARPDRIIAVVAAKQHGVLSSGQLYDAGLTPNAVARRVKIGWLHPIHQGVYAVGHAGLTRQGKWLAAVRAGEQLGREAFLSHGSAAALWELLPDGKGPIEVVVRGYGGKARRSGIRLHRSETLEQQHTRVRFGIPATTPLRTITDLRRAPRRWRISDAQLRRAIRQAGVLGYPLEGVSQDRTRSELETCFLALCHRYRIPPPAVNVVVGKFTVDFLWRDSQLVVETDGYRFHRGRAAFEDDRQRDLLLRAWGYEVVRLTYAQVTKDARNVAAILHDRLAARP